jgi:2-methylcitrate dehydratase PrpD
VATGRQSQVSAQHAVAVTLLRRRAGLAEFSDEAVAAPDVRALAAKVRVCDDAGMMPGAARLEVAFADGRRSVFTVTEATGSLERPLSDAALGDKLRTLADGVLMPGRADALADALWDMDALEDASDIMALASGSSVLGHR